jgi:hypothetical protein
MPVNEGKILLQAYDIVEKAAKTLMEFHTTEYGCINDVAWHYFGSDSIIAKEAFDLYKRLQDLQSKIQKKGRDQVGWRWNQ